jgi:DNA gyrase/topoisomerase IV subunit A
MATAMGTVKKTPLTDFANPRKAGIIAVDLDEGDHLIGVAITDGQCDVMLFSDAGKAVRFAEDDVRPMGRDGARRARHDAGRRAAGDLHAGGRQRGLHGADRDRERLRQAHADRRIHPPRPRHQGHDRDPDLGAQWQGGGGGAGRWARPATRSC